MFLASTTFDVDLDSLDKKLDWLDTFHQESIKSSSMLLKALTVSYKCPICDTDFTKQANWIQHTCIKRNEAPNDSKPQIKPNAQEQRPERSQDASQPQNVADDIFESELINNDAIDNELQKYIEV